MGDKTPPKSPPKPSSPAKADSAPSSPAKAAPTTATPSSPAAPADPSAPSSPAAAAPSSPSQANPSSPAPAGGVLPGAFWAEEPVIDDDGESAMGDSIISDTTSVKSSILRYRTLQGRRYHSEIGNASYWISNDEQSMESMDINHYGLNLGIGNKLFRAPLDTDKIHRVLDIGTGTGIWAIDFADEHPQAQVTGTDISPIQSPWVPPNLKFEIEDCTLDWTFPENSMDYIHIRWLLGSITDWNALFAQAYKTCAPGGWVENAESSAFVWSDHEDMPETSALGQWGKIFAEGGNRIGRSFTVVEDDTQRKAMAEAGFVDIQVFDYKRPLGAWPKDPIMKELGSLAQAAWEADIEGYILFIANTLGWSKVEIQVYIAHLRHELRTGKYLAYLNQRVVWGRKPE